MLLQFSWQTRNLFAEIKNYATAFSHTLLPFELADINCHNDAFAYANGFSTEASWRKFFFSLTKNTIDYTTRQFLFAVAEPYFSFSGLRAPPVLVSC